MTETSSPISLSRFLIVTLGGRYLALDIESVEAVLTLEETGGVEDPTIHGMAYGVIHLADRLGLVSDRDMTNARVVLLSERERRGNVRVSMVQGLLELQPSQILPLPMQFRGPERHWYQGLILFANSIALALNTSWVLDETVSNCDDKDGHEHTSRLSALLNSSMEHRRAC